MLAACEAIPIDTSGKLILKAAQKALSLEVLAHRAWNRGFNFNILPTDLCRATVPRPPEPPRMSWVVKLPSLPLPPTSTHSHPLPPTFVLALPTCGDNGELSYLSNVETLAGTQSHIEPTNPPSSESDPSPIRKSGHGPGLEGIPLHPLYPLRPRRFVSLSVVVVTAVAANKGATNILCRSRNQFLPINCEKRKRWRRQWKGRIQMFGKWTRFTPQLN